MNVEEATESFVDLWGSVGVQWGISRTMAQIHGLMLISPDPLTTDDIMEKLAISRGGANTNVRDLVDWGIVKRISIKGERKEYYVAEKDLWNVFRKIIAERKKREVDPLTETLTKLSTTKITGDKLAVNEFTTMVSELAELLSISSKALETASKAGTPWLINMIAKMMKV